ncbi:MAG: dTDP-4-dehydrorhamnose reductase [Eggerthellaceae bacterium]|nr:dTDP-4-dehydrorhamnose reductase [Eggerthellaceae bacterium]
MRILITGASGQLGNELRRCLESGRSEIGPVPDAYAGAEVVYADVAELDIADAAAVDAFLAARGPFDLVVNCAAITNVDGCEQAEDAAFAVNALGPENLARACAAQGAKLVHLSTDYVFPGTEPGDRVEGDPTGPISAYGRTKLAGEERALAANPRTFVFRTAWLYGYVGRNFVKTMLGLGSSRDAVTVVDDQVGNPTSANDLAHEILRAALTEDYGVYHCTNEGTCSWADFAEAIMAGAGLPCEVVRCTSAEYKQMNPASANRPAFSALENRHLAQTIGNEMRPWQEALDEYLGRLPELEG